MEKRPTNKYVTAAAIGGIATVISYFLGSILTALLPIRAYAVYLIVIAVKVFAGGILASLLYFKVIAKKPMPTGMAAAAAGISAVAIVAVQFLVMRRLFLTGTVAVLLNLVISFVVFFLTALLEVKDLQTEEGVPAPAAAAPNYNYSQNTQNPYYQTANSKPENLEGLRESLLNAIKPFLKAPITAVLCSEEEMTISNQNGTYSITGYVNSQNSYGAMIKTDFSATATFVNGTWVIGKTTVGVQTAKQNAKNFAVNYIAISIFVAVMGLLGYFIISMLIR